MSCLVINEIGSTRDRAHVLLGDIKENLTIYGLDENNKIARDDEVILTCAALPYYVSDDLTWYHDGKRLVTDDSMYGKFWNGFCSKT